MTRFLNAENIQKEKSSRSLAALTAISGIFIISALAGCSIINNEQSSQSSSVMETSNTAACETSADYISSPTASKPEIKSEIKKSYEDFIGKKYTIDISRWEKYICPEDDKPYLILINKVNPIEKNYIPEKLALVKNTRKGYNTQVISFTAAKALEALILEAESQNIDGIAIISGYRTYSYQQYLFNDYVNKYKNKFSSIAECEKYVETFSARPGTSEHQTGLACDVLDEKSTLNTSFANTKAGKWLAENSYRFGFILRYPKNKTEITGYQFEPWHFRFVGRTAATEMYINGMCLEEYLESIDNR